MLKVASHSSVIEPASLMKAVHTDDRQHFHPRSRARRPCVSSCTRAAAQFGHGSLPKSLSPDVM
jgi:hypothetical protein